MIDIIFHDKTGVTPYNPGQTGGFENAAGSGEIHYYRLFDGVGIMLLRLEMETYTETVSYTHLTLPTNSLV